ncbi:hypothetical protein FocTR4_00017211 [Fusarium oxysporum f. sp. cubense]|uniref:Uncharacterized protein n=1 Tax=Fusarium oxysporum f. sp. cubense TaxID=61366 RepID=A0A5C6SH18_FUSOC|nr:hypothetical protein FocTR4_00012042 [Fusarium oxysporum f. sp. cubense]TXB97879.1 hypothetical protein FocTR4_00017211 [Fusarium oxysporum f. sp. cubense]
MEEQKPRPKSTFSLVSLNVRSTRYILVQSSEASSLMNVPSSLSTLGSKMVLDQGGLRSRPMKIAA